MTHDLVSRSLPTTSTASFLRFLTAAPAAASILGAALLSGGCSPPAAEVASVEIQPPAASGTASAAEAPPVPERTLACGSERCGKDAPVCCVSKDRSRTCKTAAVCEADADALSMGCFQNADCPGGGECCGFPFSGMICRPHCDGIAGLRMCQSDADCQWTDWPVEGFGPPTHCQPIEGLDEGMKACSTAE